ncbi:uncharacterized protein LOC135087320 [Ostrinia nubilalis]|uniref:uncharacterized protein LOC135087320 n=1 Tax=Ostrinia nubilalis TaxID=29057 RepID=UPI0030826847
MNPNEAWMPMKDPKYCFLPTCKNCSRDHQKAFFAVPSSAKQEWCNAVGITCPKRVLYICEDHLNLEEDVENYRYWKTMKVRPKLKSRLPESLRITLSTDHQKICEPRPSTSSASSTQSNIGAFYNNPLITKASKAVQVKPKTSDRTTYCAIYKKKEQKPEVFEEDYEMEEVLPSTQGSTTSAEISETSSVVVTKTTRQGRNFMLNLIEKKPQNYIGLPKNYYWLIEYLELNLKIKSFHIIITLYKIKNSTPFYQISGMFEVSLTTLWRIFLKTLCTLSKFFKQLIFSPRVYEVKRNLPASFKTNKEYSNVFCIIDCFEIEIEKPSNPIDQSLTWSQYKNANTLKYLISVTPDGFVNFVSVGFGGRISDANIVENSGFLDVLPPKLNGFINSGPCHSALTHRMPQF